MPISRILTFVLLAGLGALPPLALAESETSWQSSVLANPRFSFPYESGEIRKESGTLYRLDEKFERDVSPQGPISPQAANFWRTCVISRFASKQGFSGWAIAAQPESKFELRAATVYFVLGNTAADIPEEIRQHFFPTTDFERICRQFLKPDYHWWK